MSILKCGACGAEMEVPGELADGQHVRCPYCNEKSIYRKPSRISLPEAQPSEINPKNRLQILRPKQVNADEERKLRKAIGVQPPTKPSEAKRRSISAAEERVRMYEGMRRKTARTKMLKNFIESAILLMLLATIVALYFWWQDHQSRLAAEAVRRREEAIRIEAERDRAKREQREKERLAHEAAKVRETEEKQRQERELRDNKENYQSLMYALKENKFDLFTRAVTNDMATSGGELCYLFPQTATPVSLYHVLCETNGTRHVFRIEQDGRKEPVSPDILDEKTKNLEYIVAKGDTVYFRSLRNTPPSGLLDITRESDPAEAFFGALSPVLQKLKPTYTELTFDIFFTPRGASKKIFTENVPFGGVWSLRNVRDAVENNITVTGTRIPKTAIKKFKRTFKIYNGMIVKQGIDGITYVPASPPARRMNHVYSSIIPNCIYRSRTSTSYIDTTREQWESLYQRALRENEAEAAYYEEQRRKTDERRNAARESDEKRWRAKVDETMRNGTLSYRIRKARRAVE